MGLVGVSQGHHHVVLLVFPIQNRHQLQRLALAVTQSGLGQSGPDLLQALAILFVAQAVVGFQSLRVAAVAGLQPLVQGGLKSVPRLFGLVSVHPFELLGNDHWCHAQLGHLQ